MNPMSCDFLSRESVALVSAATLGSGKAEDREPTEGGVGGGFGDGGNGQAIERKLIGGTAAG